MARKPTITRETHFSKAPPGYSLAESPGKWAWEKPPKYNTPPEAVDAIIDNLEKPEIQEQQLTLLAAGVSIEELVGTTVRFGFMEGMFTVDVAELIKPPLAFYYMGLAAEANIPVKVFNTETGAPRTNYGMKDSQILNIMRSRNPDLHNFVIQQGGDLAKQEMRRRDAAMAEQAAKKGSGFLAEPPMEEGE